MKKLMISILTIITLFSCSNDDDNNNPSELRIRLSNVSPFDFQNVTLAPWYESVNFESINSGESTEYKVFEIAYTYAFIELEIDGETYTLQPYDFVGETPLENGNYTYQINADDSLDQYGKLSLTFIQD
jgi:hypothetical protein